MLPTSAKPPPPLLEFEESALRIGRPLVGYQLTPEHPFIFEEEQSLAAAAIVEALETHSGLDTDFRKSSSVEKSQGIPPLPPPPPKRPPPPGKRTGPAARKPLGGATVLSERMNDDAGAPETIPAEAGGNAPAAAAGPPSEPDESGSGTIATRHSPSLIVPPRPSSQDPLMYSPGPTSQKVKTQAV